MVRSCAKRPATFPMLCSCFDMHDTLKVRGRESKFTEIKTEMLVSPVPEALQLCIGAVIQSSRVPDNPANEKGPIDSVVTHPGLEERIEPTSWSNSGGRSRF